MIDTYQIDYDVASTRDKDIDYTNMNKLEMIIYISDFVEESRTFVTEELRNLAEVNLKKTVYKILLDTKEYLESNHKAVSNLTLEAIKFYKEICGGI